ncbi:MAG: polyphosphate kinase 1, partial [Bacteroidota bacterium]
DLAIFTADKRLTAEVSHVFSFLENVKPPAHPFQHLMVGKFNLRSGLDELIDREIEAAKAGREAGLIIKLNSLEDREVIAKLYEASQAGVKVKLIIRGICCLVPGLPGISDNIEIISIIDRFLEHARVLIFHNGGKELMYLSSADWMERNLSFRIETTFPVLDPEIQAEIRSLIDLQLNDNVKARILDKEDQNEYRRTAGDLPVRAQLETYFHFKRKTKPELL